MKLRKIFSLLCLMFFMPLFSENKKLNVLFCVKSFPAYTNWFILHQITEFVRKGHNVTILARDPQSTTANDNHPDIVQYNLIEKTHVNYLPEELRSFDLILCQFSSLAPYIIDFKEKNNVEGKLFIFVRGAFCHRKESQKELREKIFREADRMVPICEFSKKQLLRLGCDPKKIIIVHSTIDCDKFDYSPRSLPKDEIKIVTTSRLTEQKGLEYAIKAMRTVLKKYPNCMYRIIGDGELHEKLEKLIRKLHLEKNVLLLGWKIPSELQVILNDSHIFLHPSVTKKNGGHEAIPTSIMQALATGVPSICTYHAGIPELIKNNKTGYLVPERDYRSLAKKIIYLIKNPKKWNKIGLAGRKAVEKDHEKHKENERFINYCENYIFSQ